MCGRFVSSSSPARLAARFSVAEIDGSVGDDEPDYNVSPRRRILVVRARDEHRVLSRVRWGLVPSWAKDPGVGDRMINARSETVAEKPAFRRAFARRRCIVPADGFYEWRAAGVGRSVKQPYYVHAADGAPFAFAGLWETWKVPDAALGTVGDPDGWLRTCTILTTTANAALAPIHDRMPVVLPEPAWADWLDPDLTDPGALLPLLGPAPATSVRLHPVARAVGNARNRGPELIDPLPEAGPGPDPAG